MHAIADTGSHIEPWFAALLVILALVWLAGSLIREIRNDVTAPPSPEEERRGTSRRARG